MTSVEGENDFFAARRVASDSGAPNLTRLGEGEVHDGLDAETQVSPRSEHDIEASGLHVGGRPARGRWKWVAGLLGFRAKQGR